MINPRKGKYRNGLRRAIQVSTTLISKHLEEYIMDQRENRVSASFEVRAIDDATVAVEGYAAVFNQETVIGGQ